MNQEVDLLIIGSGPAGMAAAIEAAENSVNVCVIDDQSRPGGQIYRNVGAASSRAKNILGPDYQRGETLVQEFYRLGGEYLPNTSVWYLDGERRVGIVHQDQSRMLYPKNLIIATGAQERPMPVAGWQLPGVMYAGAAQILLKGAYLVPEGRIVLAGSGPLLLLLANQLLDAGVNISALLDTTPPGRLMKSINKVLPALRGSDYLYKGVKLLARLKTSGIPIHHHVNGLSAQGDQKLETVSFRSTNGSPPTHNIDADYLFLHNGVVPNLRLPLATEAPVEWSSQQLCWVARADAYGRTGEGIYAVGDCARISGARASESQGTLAGLHVASTLGKITGDLFQSREKQALRSIRRHTAVRPLLDALYAPAREYLVSDDDTVVCRCEEVTAKQLRDAIKLGCVGPNQVKSFTRCGMGPCQGTQCSNSLNWVLADALGKPMEEIGLLRNRPPLAPVTLGQIADL